MQETSIREPLTEPHNCFRKGAIIFYGEGGRLSVINFFWSPPSAGMQKILAPPFAIKTKNSDAPLGVKDLNLPLLPPSWTKEKILPPSWTLQKILVPLRPPQKILNPR